MGVIGNRYLQGQPILPYVNVKAYQSSDVFLDVEFVDHTQTPVIPTSMQLEIDDITNAQAMLGPVTLNPAGAGSGTLLYPAFAASWNLQVTGAVMQMTFPYEGSQLCQFKFAFTAIDTVTGQPFTAPAIVMVELCSAATVSGTF
jgi:hypothetical protein